MLSLPLWNALELLLLELARRTAEKGNAMGAWSGLATPWRWGWMLSWQIAKHCWVGALFRHLPDGWKWAAWKTVLRCSEGFCLVASTEDCEVLSQIPTRCQCALPLQPTQRRLLPHGARAPVRARHCPEAGTALGAGSGTQPSQAMPRAELSCRGAPLAF